MVDEFRKCEDIGRERFKSMFSKFYRYEFDSRKYGEYDVLATGKTLSEPTYVIEIKNYNYPRRSDKFADYQLDWRKLYYLEKAAMERNSIPILIAFFTDKCVVWDISKIDWKSRERNVNCNDKGVSYGETKSASKETWLYINEGKTIEYDKT